MTTPMRTFETGATRDNELKEELDNAVKGH